MMPVYIYRLNQCSYQFSNNKSAITREWLTGYGGPGGLLLGAAVTTVVVGMFVIIVQQSVLSVVDSVVIAMHI